MDWRYDLEKIELNKIVMLFTVNGLERKGRVKVHAKPRRNRRNMIVLDCWGVEPHADLVAVAWRDV